MARIARIPVSRLSEIETDQAEPTVFELEQLALVYGIDAPLLLNRPVKIGPDDIVVAFASLDEFRKIADIQRFKIIEAANAARELHSLESLLGVSPRDDVVRIAHNKGVPPYRQGAGAAAKVRERFGLAHGPIGSVRDFLTQRVTGVQLFYAELGREGGLAGVTFADTQTRPTIVLNLEGKNRNPVVRRFSLAHELGHLFIDHRRQKPLAILSGDQTESDLEIEQRANAFAVRFLCPQGELESLPHNGLEAAKCLMRDYGMHYAAARLYLRNERKGRLPERIPEVLLADSADYGWEAAEAPRGLSEFPLERVPPERRTHVAAAAANAYSRGKISRKRFAELLRVPPTEEVEQVLDFFALPSPRELDDVA